MPRLLFADAGYWIAVLDVHDILHTKAQSLSDSLSPFQILTTEMTLTEAAGHFAAYGPHYRNAVVALIKAIRQADDIEVAPQTAEQFAAALAHFERYRDKEWSLVDCASFLLMTERGIHEALAYDHHFGQAGFRPLLREP